MLQILFVLQVLVDLFSGKDVTKEALFKAQTIDDNVAIGYGLALGDVDGDKKPDILLADKKQFVWYRNGDWKKFVMVENLTTEDNVCIAAKDLDGDGKVEVAVGAQWNPGETTDDNKSGSVHFLVRPKDPTQKWSVVNLYHEPTIHRMRWVQSADKNFYLAVLPLHGKGNKGGEGTPVNLLLYKYPELLRKAEPAFIVETKMHLTHNLEPLPLANNFDEGIYLAAKEGIGYLSNVFNQNSATRVLNLPGFKGAGELRIGKLAKGEAYLATIEPMHGTSLVLYTGKEHNRQVLDTNLKEGHALQAADVLGLGYDQVIAGWRVPNKEGKVGVKLYQKSNGSAEQWTSQWIDDNEMACEDLQVADLNGDGRLDIIAAGRATHNLKIYWNGAGDK